MGYGGAIQMNKDSVPESKKIFTQLPRTDSPDMLMTDNISIFDLHEDMQTVDAIPVGEMKKRVKAEGDELLETRFRNE